jgi:hypothetical protein
MNARALRSSLPNTSMSPLKKPDKNKKRKKSLEQLINLDAIEHNQSEPKTLVDTILSDDDYASTFLERIPDLIRTYKYDGDFLQHICQGNHNNKIEYLRMQCFQAINKKFELGEFFLPRTRTGPKAYVNSVLDIFIMIHSLYDAILPLEKINDLFRINIKPADFFPIMEHFNASRDLKKGDSNSDIAANIGILGKAIENLIQHNAQINKELKQNSDAIAMLQIQNDKQGVFKYNHVDSKTKDPNALKETYRPKRLRESANSDDESESSSLWSKKPSYAYQVKKPFNTTTVLKHKKTISTGNGSKNKHSLKSAMHNKAFSVYIGRIDNSESVDSVGELLETMKTSINLQFSNLAELQRSHSKFKSFRFEIPYDQRSLIYDENNWPEGIVLSKYNPPRAVKPSAGTSTLNKSNYCATNNEPSRIDEQ